MLRWDDDIRVEINFRDIRTYLKEEHSILFTRDSVQKPPEGISELLKENEKVLVREYGLKKDNKYYLVFHSDEYYINGPSGPKKKTNLVLWISDKPFKDNEPQSDLTPNYRGWTY